MRKVLGLILAFVLATVAAKLDRHHAVSKQIHRLSSSSKQNMNGIDLCSTCVSTFDDLIYFIIDGTIEVGIINSCNDICDYVTQKSTNPYLPAICSIGCDIVGVNEFIKLATEVDLDPIYFCDSLNICPIKDDGDAKFTFFTISPPRAPATTTFNIDMTYQTVNGTGTGQLLLTIETIDAIKIAPFFLVEAKAPGNYSERISIDTTPDPDCESATDPCEEWWSGIYNVTVLLCNGECGSHHPHSNLYDAIQTSFIIE